MEATPSRVGRTYLRHVHDCIHLDSELTGLERYCRRVPLSECARGELKWWSLILQHDLRRFAYSVQSAVLIPTFGDGSGTGTGGTLDLPELPLQMWMGQWAPFIMRCSSNWKELKTLHVTLQQAAASYATSVRGTTLFYFTDNSGTYWIGNKGSSRVSALHKLIQEIKLLELTLGIDLQVVHVPGTAMIEQSTDGLSRGIWATELHTCVDQKALTASVFAPVPFSHTLVDVVLSRI